MVDGDVNQSLKWLTVMSTGSYRWLTVMSTRILCRVLWVGSIFVSLKEGWEPQGMLQVGRSLLVCMYVCMCVCV